MTESENFILRWARLKHAADTGHEPDPPEPDPPEPGSLGAAEAVAAGTDAAPDGPFDPESLPPIDAITVDTDIRAFLRYGVPAELTRAALRRVWTSDPAIRDFIGIAENQWDFNDPDAIPGFGPLPATGNVADLLAQIFGKPEQNPAALSQTPGSAEPPLPAATDDGADDPGQGEQQAVDGAEPTDHIGSSPDDRGEKGSVSGSNRLGERDDLPGSCRSHGGALPR
jgi:hypothetical protein